MEDLKAGHGLAFINSGEKHKSQRKFGLMTLRGFVAFMLKPWVLWALLWLQVFFLEVQCKNMQAFEFQKKLFLENQFHIFIVECELAELIYFIGKVFQILILYKLHLYKEFTFQLQYCLRSGAQWDKNLVGLLTIFNKEIIFDFIVIFFQQTGYYVLKKTLEKIKDIHPFLLNPQSSMGQSIR